MTTATTMLTRFLKAASFNDQLDRLELGSGPLAMLQALVVRHPTFLAVAVSATHVDQLFVRVLAHVRLLVVEARLNRRQRAGSAHAASWLVHDQVTSRRSVG